MHPHVPCCIVPHVCCTLHRHAAAGVDLLIPSARPPLALPPSHPACLPSPCCLPQHIMIDLGTGNNNKINWAMNDKQEFIDIVETVSARPPRDELDGGCWFAY